MSEGSEPVFCIRPAGPGDQEFLWDMLYEAIHWVPERSGPKPPREKLLPEPEISHYLKGWGREGDAAAMAVTLDGDRRIGAIWYRLMPVEDPGYGFVDASTPEIGLAVAPDFRGRGVGGALLRAIMEEAKSGGFDALSLSVERTNPAVRLYESYGFERLFEVGASWTMKVDLSRTEGTVPEPTFTLKLLEEVLTVCRLDPDSKVPEWSETGSFCSITRTPEELSIVCPEQNVPRGLPCESGWRALKLEGPLEFSAVGVLNSVAEPLAVAGVSIFVLSTYDTDYVLVREDQLHPAVAALRDHGHETVKT